MRTEARGVVAVTDDLERVPTNRYVVFGLLVAAGLTWDLWTKAAVFSSLGIHERTEWEWTCGEFVRFFLQTNLNYGALWGIGQGWTGLFAALSFVAVFGVLYFLFWLKHARSWWLTVALGFVLAGALGNLHDRLGLHGIVEADRSGGVRDFLHFRFFETFDWATFNFADSFLVTGAIMLVIHSFRSEPDGAAELTTNAVPASASASDAA